ncbi:5-hydroxytryptamine receptor 1F-like [Actinia tenebrosa]|uniref:5-hydroxytryptamine receptor 1F-like n=1 Tax=Actinia tenebrosa TaxID=6105 RepID=A0A6P8H969_ACTTE|nr:5-hydroxytryptamine receptor 1F-like [Actinia tenebrosa]
MLNVTRNTVTSSWGAEKLTVFILFLSVIDGLAILGNTLVILVILWTKSLRRMEANSFVMSLSIADLLVALTIVPITIASLVNPQNHPYDKFKTFLGVGNFFFCICSIMNLTLLSLDRYFAITSPYRYLDFLTHKRACSLCILIWVYSLGFSLPPVFGISSYSCFIPNFETCREDVWRSSDTLVFALLVLGFTYGLSLVSMSYCYWKIFKVARSHSRRIAAQQSFRISVKTKNQFVEQNARTTQNLALEVSKAEEIKSQSIQSHQNGQINGNDTETAGFRWVEKSLIDIVIAPWIIGPKRPINTKNPDFEHSLHSSADSDGSSKNSDKNFTKNEMRVARSFLIVIGLYVLCWTPFCLILALEIFLRRKLSEEASLICLWIGYTNSCVNPFIYTWKYRQFRCALIRLWRNCKLLLRE